MNLRGNRKLIAFCVAMGASTLLVAFDKLGSEAFMAVAIAALGGFFTANVINNRPPAALAKTQQGPHE